MSSVSNKIKMSVYSFVNYSNKKKQLSTCFCKYVTNISK